MWEVLYSSLDSQGKISVECGEMDKERILGKRERERRRFQKVQDVDREEPEPALG